MRLRLLIGLSHGKRVGLCDRKALAHRADGSAAGLPAHRDAMSFLIQRRSFFLSRPNAQLHGRKWLLLLVLYVVVCESPPVRAQTNSTDATAMEALKSSLFPSSSSALQAQNWTSSSDICGFTSCGPPSCSMQSVGLLTGAAGEIPVCNWCGVCCTSWEVTGISLSSPAISVSTFQRSLPEELSQMQNLQVLQLPQQG